MLSRLILVSVAASALAAVPAYAGFSTLHFQPSDEADGPESSFVNHDVITQRTADYTPDAQDPEVQGQIQVAETLHTLGYDANVTIYGVTDGDPIFRLGEEITNDTGYTWTEYSFTIDGSGATFTGAATSGQFASSEFLNGGKTLHFFSGSVPDGATADFLFRINVPSTGDFSICFQQGPVGVPEPASLGLIALGVMGLLTRRR